MNISQANLRNMLNAISKGNHVLNEQVRLYKSTKVDCPDCGYDPIRKESTNPFCQTCDGQGQISTESYQEIPASVETEEDLRYEFTQAGRLQRGQILLTIDIKEINEVLNADNAFDLSDSNQIKKFVEQYDYFWWKGSKFTVSSYEAGWLQGNLYEISFVLNLKE